MATHQPLTLAEFDARYAGRRYEYVDGRALPRGPEVPNEDGNLDVQPKTPEQQFLTMRVAYAVSKHVLDNHLGVPLPGGVGFFMQHDPPEIRECDFAFLSPEKARLCRLGEWLPFPPDFAVEIVSAWDSEAYIQRKSHSYMANGCRLLWVIYPTERQVYVWRPEQDVERVTAEQTLTGDDVVRHLRVPVTAILANT